MVKKDNPKLVVFFLSLVSLFTIHHSLFTREALAHCPLCTAGAGAGLAISRFIGIDDSITGVWLAAFLGATSFWSASYIKKKYVPFQDTIIYIAIFGITIWSFSAFNLVDEHAGLIMGVPKLYFGMTTAGILFYLVDVVNRLIKKVKGGVLFPYQPIVFSLSSMVLLSAAIFVFINYYV